MPTFTSGGTNGYSSGGPPGYTTPTGSITGQNTAFGTVELIFDEAGPDYLVIAISSPVGTPTTIYIGSTGYPLIFDGTVSGYDFYLTDGKQTFSNGVSYYWGFVPDSTYAISAEAGSFAVTGAAAGIGVWQLAAGAGSFSVSGADADLRKGRILNAEAGAFTLAGGEATFRYFSLLAEAGAFSLVGGESNMVPFFKSYKFTGPKGAARSAPHIRASISMRRSTSIRSRR